MQNNIRQYTISNHSWKKKLFGQHFQQKQHGICRIVSQNINCIGIRTNNIYKTSTLKDWLHQNEVDICGLQETGIAQHMFQQHERLAERMRDHRRENIRMCSANNTHESIERLQYGGTAVFAYDYMSHLVKSSGTDDTGLGRWCLLKLEGHRSKIIRIISAYNPCRTPVHHYATVYAQHKRYCNDKNMDVCPRKQFCRDLGVFISKCQDESESIVLLIDCNENLAQLHPLQQMLTQSPHFLIDPIRLKYDEGQQLPPTTDKGSYPIDAIFVSPNLVHIDAGGWLPIQNGLSDHRPLYIDIPIKLLIGKYKNSTQLYAIRRLKCNNKPSVDRYNQLLAQQYEHHHTLQKLEEFKETMSDPLTEEDKQKLFKIDKVCTQVVLYAEKNCRRIFVGGKPYTPELNRLGRKIYAWRMIVKKKLGYNISSQKIKRAALAHDIPHFKTLSLQECIIARANAYSEYRNYAKHSHLHRPDFLDTLAEEQMAEGHEQEAKRLMQQKQQEETRLVHRNVKIATKDFIGAPYRMELQQNGRTFISADRDQLEAAMIEEYDAKYRLARSSPFINGPLAPILGPMALNENAKKIVRGEFVCPPNIEEHTKTFIEHLEMDDKIKDAPPNRVRITTEESNAFWKNMNEKVSSSPSKRHIGTYKAAALHPINAHVQAEMLSLPYETGTPLPRTTNCINVSLMKKGKGITPSDMRTIWLMEADLNAGAKIHFVKRMVNETAIGNGLIPASQYAKKHSRAIEAAIVKILFFDYLRQTRKPGIMFASDLMHAWHTQCAHWFHSGLQLTYQL